MRSHGQTRTANPRRMRLAALVAALAVLVAACTSSGNNNASQHGTPTTGGVVTWANPPGGSPSYIFPIITPAQFSNTNIQWFGRLIFLPLYWIGQGDNPLTIDNNLSIANPPVWSDNDRVVTVTLRNLNWSDGTPVSARDVEFWQNLVNVSKTDNANYVPGLYPDNVVKTTVVNPTTFSFTLNKSYDPNWFLYNELSQITPLPLAWDKTCATCPAGTADQTTAGAQAVYKYLAAQSSDLNTYATNPLWQVVDGPWRLQAFQTNGYTAFVPNPKYTGPAKPKISKFVEQPYVSPAAELDALRSGSGPDIGFVQASDSGALPALEHSGYVAHEWVDWNTSIVPLNYINPTAGPIFKQLYVRQALQELMDQNSLINFVYHGYAWPDYGPVPPQPVSSALSSYAKTNHYPFSIDAAKSLLAQHGWAIQGGVQTCVRPGSGQSECGPGVNGGATLKFTMDTISGVPVLTEEMQSYVSTASKAGVNITLSATPGAQILSIITGANKGWQIANYGFGWTYIPDYYPTGESLFATGAAANYGSYTDPTMDKYIQATETAPASQSQAALTTYQNYVAKELPVLFEPVPAYQITVAKSNLGGVFPQNPDLEIDPNYFFYYKT